jgi:hypothetical protein
MELKTEAIIKIKQLIKRVQQADDDYEFEYVTVEEVNFYNESFWELVILIENATGYKLYGEDTCE